MSEHLNTSQLAKGVRVFSPSPFEIRQRIALCDGVMPAKEVDRARPRYTEDAVVPKGNWHACTNHQWQSLVSGADLPSRLSDVVAIIRCPHDVLDPFLSIGRRALHAPNALTSHRDIGGFSAAMKGLRDLLVQYGGDPESIQPLGLSLKRAGQVTTTVNEHKRRRIGMHLDRWDEMPLADTSATRVRLNFNLGESPRYFLFVNLPANEMAAKLSNPSIEIADVGRTFLAEHPDYPIIRLRVDPGDAYLAATDYLIHDATTQDLESGWDVHASTLTRFDGTKILELAI